MGFVGRLLGIRGSTSGPPCPDCGRSLWRDSDQPGRYECRNDGCAGWGLYNDADGVLLDPPSLAQREGGGPGCEMCESSLAGGVRYLPYENGGNPDAYIVCPSCGHENVQYGFGGDD
jgi:predicted RNA-binding Zn-ribbon protein involved in translation (DUF1610 family)